MVNGINNHNLRDAISLMELERAELKRRQQVLRTRCCRIRKIIRDNEQLDLKLTER